MTFRSRLLSLALILPAFSVPAFSADTADLRQLYAQLREAKEVRLSPEDLATCDYVSNQTEIVTQALKALQDSDLKVIPWAHSFYKGPYSFVEFTLDNGQRTRFMFDREYAADDRIDAALQLPNNPDLIWINARWSIHRELFNLARKIRTPTVTLEMIREQSVVERSEESYLREQRERLGDCTWVIDRPSRFRDHSIRQTCRGKIPYAYVYDGKEPETCPGQWTGGWIPDPYLEGAKP